MWNIFISNLYFARYLTMYKEYPVLGGDYFVLIYLQNFTT